MRALVVLVVVGVVGVDGPRAGGASTGLPCPGWPKPSAQLANQCREAAQGVREAGAAVRQESASS